MCVGRQNTALGGGGEVGGCGVGGEVDGGCGEVDGGGSGVGDVWVGAVYVVKLVWVM